MASRRYSIVHLYRAERRAIVLLRGAPAGETGPDGSPACFGEVRTRAETLGLVLLPLESDFVGDDEIRLLSWISRLQGQKPVLEEDLDEDFQAALRSCAVHLRALGLRLPYRNAARAHLLPELDAAPAVPDEPRAIEALAPPTVSPRLARARRLQLLSRTHGRTVDQTD